MLIQIDFCALTMETVNHTREVFRVVEETGFRATVGKCMMDKGEEVPAGLREGGEDSIRESLALLERWHGRADGRVRYCFAPRFAVSCTRELLERVAALAKLKGLRAPHPGQVQYVGPAEAAAAANTASSPKESR